MPYTYNFTFRALEGRELNYTEIDNNHRAVDERVSYIENNVASQGAAILAQAQQTVTGDMGSVTPAAGKMPIANGSGYISNGWLDSVGAGKVMREGAGGWLGLEDGSNIPPVGYPTTPSDATTRVLFYGVDNEGVPAYAPTLQFATYDSWVRISASQYYNSAFVQAGLIGVGGWTAELYHNKNTTVDGSGFIKSASPILKLKTDSFDVEGFTKDCNPQAYRLSKGVYEITGTQGLRSDGWYIETPADRNGNKYFNVEWSQNIEQPLAEIETPVGGIVVTLLVFDRVWNKDTGTFENGAPLDINDLQDRWIDLRFNEVVVKHEELAQ